jgi:hypothetical protein
MRKQRAQSTLEYIVILTAIVSAIIVGVATYIGKKDDKTKGIGLLMDKSANRITTETARLSTELDP